MNEASTGSRDCQRESSGWRRAARGDCQGRVSSWGDRRRTKTAASAGGQATDAESDRACKSLQRGCRNGIAGPRSHWDGV